MRFCISGVRVMRTNSALSFARGLVHNGIVLGVEHCDAPLRSFHLGQRDGTEDCQKYRLRHVGGLLRANQLQHRALEIGLLGRFLPSRPKLAERIGEMLLCRRSNIKSVV